jgi:hypothetical protein
MFFKYFAAQDPAARHAESPFNHTFNAKLVQTCSNLRTPVLVQKHLLLSSILCQHQQRVTRKHLPSTLVWVKGCSKWQIHTPYGASNKAMRHPADATAMHPTAQHVISMRRCTEGQKAI